MEKRTSTDTPPEEFKFGKTKNKMLSLNTKVSYIGGNYYTPIDLPASIANDGAVYGEAFSKKAEDVFILNFGANLQINRKKTTHMLKLEMLNATNNQSRLNEYYRGDTQEIGYNTQLSMIPNLMYQVQF